MTSHPQVQQNDLYTASRFYMERHIAIYTDE